MSAQQRQNRTYQILVVALLLAEPVLVLFNLDAVKGWTTHLLGIVEHHQSFFAHARRGRHCDPAQRRQRHLLWTVLIALNFILLSQIIRLLEYFCFRRKNLLD